MAFVADAAQLIRIKSEHDVVLARTAVKTLSSQLGFSLVNQTKIVTAASELARNTLEHGGGGQVQIESIELGSRVGIRMRFEDEGPGISDIAQALTDGFTTGKGMGLGLSGSKRLMDEFDIQSKPGFGTTVIISKWK